MSAFAKVNSLHFKYCQSDNKREGGSGTIFSQPDGATHLQGAVQQTNYKVKLLVLQHGPVALDMVAHLLRECQSHYSTLEGTQYSRENLQKFTKYKNRNQYNIETLQNNKEINICKRA